MNEELNIETTRNNENEVTVVMDAITDRSQVINRLQEIVSDISLANKTELEHLKQGFYKLLHTEQEAKKADYVANGGNIEEYVSEKDELEEQYKQLMKIIKEKRAAQQEALEIIRKENLKKKYELLDRFNALIEKASTENVPFNEVKAIQKEWKEIGPVTKKYSEPIWKRFVSACDYFFEQKSKAESASRSVEQDNLDKKKAIIEKLNIINQEENPSEKSGNTIRELMKEWNNIGHVPFKEKDRIYKQYRTVVDALFGKLNHSASRKKLSNFKSNLNKETNLYREREKLVRLHDNMKNEIKTYENNIGFLTSSSKKGNNLVAEMNRKIEKLRADLELVTQKIAVIDESIRE
jgi:hypothetical protein